MDWQALPNAPRPGTYLGAIDDIDDGGVRMLTLGETAPSFHLLLLRSGSRIFGYLNRCAHFGVPLANQPQHLLFEAHKYIKCNIHYARYNWEDGLCIAGECVGEHLVRLPLDVADGQIYIARHIDKEIPE